VHPTNQFAPHCLDWIQSDGAKDSFLHVLFRDERLKVEDALSAQVSKRNPNPCFAIECPRTDAMSTNTSSLTNICCVLFQVGRSTLVI